MYAVGVINPGASGSFAGGVYLYQATAGGGWGSGGDGAISETETYGQYRGRWWVTIPYGVVPLYQPASVVSYGGRLYMTGGYSYNVMIDEHHRMWKQGIRPPEEVPDIQYTPDGSGNTTIAYFTWYDEYTGERSPLSKGIELANCGYGTTRIWQNLPRRPPDDVYIGDDQVTWESTVDGDSLSGGSRISGLRPGDKVHLLGSATVQYAQCWHYKPLLFSRHQDWTALGPTSSGIAVATVSRATHLELWLSVAGDFPRLYTRTAIGSDTLTESAGVENLGEAFIDSFQRFPRCEINTIYHDRQIMAGDPENPDTVFLSELFYPERFSGITFKTRSGEPITGLLATKDYALVFTQNNTYMLQGYNDSDYTLTVVDQSLGSVGHNCNVVIFGNPYVWTEKGPYMFNGQWHPLSPENRWTPVGPALSNVLPPRDHGILQPGRAMFATEDPFFNTYIVSEAYIAAQEIEQPWKYEFGSEGQTIPYADSSPYDRYFAVLDYTRVQPESGGSYSSARLMWDEKARSNNISNPNRTVPEWQHYLRSRWGSGALYHVGHYESNYRTLYRAQTGSSYAVPSFTILAMQVARYKDPAPVSSYKIAQTGVLKLGFDMLGEVGGSTLETKSFKRMWFHMRRGLNTVLSVRTEPNAGYWNNRLFDEFVPGDQMGTPGLDGIQYKVGGLYQPLLYSVDPENRMEGDLIIPVRPTNLAGRGLWLQVTGQYFHFHGWGGEYIVGRDNQHLQVEPEPV